MRWADALLTSVPNDAPGAGLKTQGQAQQTSQSDKGLLLVERHMNDSYSELILPFGSDPQLLEQYTNASGGIRMGKSVEIPVSRFDQVFISDDERQIDGAPRFSGGVHCVQTHVGSRC